MAKQKKAKKIPIKMPIMRDRMTVPEGSALEARLKKMKEAEKRARAESKARKLEKQMRAPRLTPIPQTKLEKIQRIKRVFIKGTGLSAVKAVSSPEERTLVMSRVDTLNRAHDFLKAASMKQIADSLASRKQFSHEIGKEVSEEEFAVIKKSVEIAPDKDSLLRGLRATRGELERVLREHSEAVPIPPAGAERAELAAGEIFGVPLPSLYAGLSAANAKKFAREMRRAEKLVAKGKAVKLLEDPALFKKKFGVEPTQEELLALSNLVKQGKASEFAQQMLSVEKPFSEIGESARKISMFRTDLLRARTDLENGRIPGFLRSPEAFQKKFGVKPSKQALGEIRRMIETGQTDLLIQGIVNAEQAQGRLLQKDLRAIQRTRNAIKTVSGIKLAHEAKRLEAFRDFNQKLLKLLEQNKEKILRGETPEELKNARKFKKYFGLTPEEAEEISKRIEKGALIGGAAGATAGTVFVLSQASLFAPMPLIVPASSYAVSGFGIGGLAGKISEEGVYKARQFKTRRIVKKIETEKDYDLFIRSLRANIREIDKKLQATKGGKKNG